MKVNYLKLFLILFAGLYFFYYAFSPGQWNFLDGVNLVIHEAGHWIFSFFGEILYVAGGSLTQIILPTVFAIYFFSKKEMYSGSFVLFWVGQNILNVATYVGDAVKMQLPLLGGNENVTHDWNYLLAHFGLLHYTDQISGGLQTIAVLVFMLAVFLGIKACFEKQEPELR